MTVATRFSAVVARVLRLKPVRVLTHYAARRGPLLAAGLAYQAIFAVFAALWVGAAAAGLVVTSSPALRQSLFRVLGANVPGLIDTGNGGAIDPNQLLQVGVLGWTGAIAAVGLLVTALAWLASGRDAVRALFGLDAQATNLLLLKLKDLGLAAAFGAAVVLTAGVSLASTSALRAVLAWAGVDGRSDVTSALTRAAGFGIVLVLDVAILGAFYRIVSGVAIPPRLLARGSLIAGAALGVLMTVGSALLGQASSNPLLASFAVIIGLLIWFNLVCQVVLLGASWIAVSAADAGVELTGRVRPSAESAPVGRITE